MAAGIAGKVQSRASRADWIVPAGAVAIVFMLVVPLPHWLLDLLLAMNITLALGILLLTFHVQSPLEFSSFPSMLLLVTLFRLALNISATRLILGTGEAGSIIAAFGSFVIGGNFVVGIVVFVVLIVIQFMVITSGAGRVAEVAARFTLDAMPGRQMAIDAELNAGVIDEATARQRRQGIAREADFFGAMDGASKFVRGDAMAAMLMIMVNVLGGFAVGIFQRGLDLSGALQSYTMLSVGEGIVTQIPALLISAASGLIVTRPGSRGSDGAQKDSNLGAEITRQLVAHPQALLIAAGMLSAMALVPGLPKLPFLALAGGIGWFGLQLQKQRSAPPPPAPPAPQPPENMADLLTVETLEVEVGYGLVCLADLKQGGDLLERITAVRRQIATELGFLVPPIRVRDNVRLRANQYSVRLRGLEIGGAELFPQQLLAMDSGMVSQPVAGLAAEDPAFGLPAVWIPANQRTAAEVSGYTVVEPTNVLVTHLSELVRRHAPEILTRQDVQALLDTVKQKSPAVVEELVSGLLTLGQVQKVLQLLLRERVSIRDLTTVLEAMADSAAQRAPGGHPDLELIAERVRQRLARGLTKQHAAGDGRLYCFTLHPAVEQMIVDSIQRTEAGLQLALEPTVQRQLREALRAQAEKMVAAGHQPMVLCAPRVRHAVRLLTQEVLPTLVVLSYLEVAAGAGVEALGIVSWNNEGSIV